MGLPRCGEACSSRPVACSLVASEGGDMAAIPFALGRVAAACAGAALLAAAGGAPAQSWKPQQPVEVIIGSNAGSSPDIMARSIQRIWQEKRMVEVPANVVNRVGGGNTVAWNFLNSKQ